MTKLPFNPWEIEAEYRQSWAEQDLYNTPEPVEGQNTYYGLEFFPYPSGAGLSVGHGRNYVPSDVLVRYHRMRGDAVMHPMGWDAFGLPAENEAIKVGVHPAVSTRKYEANYRHQLELLGCSYDWSREFSSSQPDYYRWNQLFFLMLYRSGLAYRANAPVSWCPNCQTVLAEEEIEHGTCWRCHSDVVQRDLPQWYIRVTAYAEELHNSLDNVDWPSHIVTMQRNWIGRTEGWEITFSVGGTQEAITAFTTRPETLYGVTFMAMSPAHPQAMAITAQEHKQAVHDYIHRTHQQSRQERRKRTTDGVFTGVRAELPNGELVPIYIADYALMTYGTGVVMGVPAHDERDFDFAQHFAVPVKRVILGDSPVLPYEGKGHMVNSGGFDGLPSEQASEAIPAMLAEKGLAQAVTRYKLRDWLISRQRYWGTPIPIVHCPHCGVVPVAEADLPVRLPDLPDYQPRGDGRSPLANVPQFLHTVCPQCGGDAQRETDTMTGFVCSSWYYLRFTDPHNSARPFDPIAVKRWLPVDVYMGGAEHAVGHLMFSRFWTKFLADERMIDFREPFPVLRSQGVLHIRNRETGVIERMSKSKGNVVTPESVIEHYGADITRLYLMFMGPVNANVTWEVEDDGVTPLHIEGVRRFLARVWRIGLIDMFPNDQHLPKAGVQALINESNQTVQAVTDSMTTLRFNTAISAMMTYAVSIEGYAKKYPCAREVTIARDVLVRLLAPFAPFVTEKLWAMTGQSTSIHQGAWPVINLKVPLDATVEYGVLVNGKLRDRISVNNMWDEVKVQAHALARNKVQQAVDGAEIVRVIVIPNRVVNIVTT